MDNIDKVNNKSIGGVEADIYASLSQEDRAFLSLLERLGLSLSEVYQRMEKKVTA